MPSHHPTIDLISETTEDAIDHEFRLRVTFRLLMDLHGPAAVINYANEHAIRCDTCRTCGWSPHIDDECILCDTPHNDAFLIPHTEWL